MSRSARSLLTVLLVASLAACTGTSSSPATHDHGSGAALVSMPVGDGTRAQEVGYSLEELSVPRRAGRPGEVSFRIGTFRGTPQLEFLVEQTKRLHLYVVRDDLTGFRHLHPTMEEDGTWTAPVVLPSGGDYRVVAEFVAEDDGGNGDHVILGGTRTVPGPAGSSEAAGSMLDVTVAESPTTGPDSRLGLRVRDREGRPVQLGTYLGAFAHVTGFHRESGVMVHLHPLTDPEITEDGSLIGFHTEIEQAGEYRLFVQVRVDGYLHTVPVDLTVT